MNDDDEPEGYTWEVDYADGLNIRDVLHEDESGSIEKSVAKLILDTKRKKRLNNRPAKVRLGIMRYLYLVIDCSFSMADKSIPPSRLAVTIKALNQFLDKFSEQNPISQVGIVVCKDKRAECLIPLTGNVRLVKESLSTITEVLCHGEFSLHNSLMAAIKSLHSYPGYASREVILIVASLSTCDPSNIFGTFELLKRYHIRCSVISLSAEVFIFRKLCSATSGCHNVILDSTHFEVILNEHANPPISSRNAESSVVRMGFPAHESIDSPSFCLCHQSEIRPSGGRGFFCPQCGARYCSLPVECRICKLTLISAPQLARSLHNLLPLPAFEEIDTTERVCFACIRQLDDKSFVCKNCKSTIMKKINGKVKKPAVQSAKLNPFELKYNRSKHRILGTKAVSAACGAPGLSKKKAFENRTRTLAVEWKERGKRNKIIDQRIGEANSMMDNEECISKRFTAERLKIFEATNSELTNEEKLTHRGRELAKVEKYDRSMLSDEDDDDEARGGGSIGASTVAAIHFGGGVAAFTEDTASKRRNFITELIAKTKQQRYDKKLARDEREDATERLDKKWNEIQQTDAISTFVRPVKDKSSMGGPEKDDYDHLFYELQMDSGKRGEASERQKTKEEIAYEEREKLVRQEKARLARIDKDDIREAKKKSGTVGNKEDFVVKYDGSGVLMNAEKLKKGRIKVVRTESSDEGYEFESDEVDENEEEDDFDALVNGDEQINLPPSSLKNIAANAETKIRKGSENGELPFVIDLPQKYESLKKLLDAENDANCEVIIKRLIKLYHPSLREGNKSQLGRLFTLLLRYYDDLSKERVVKITLIGYISRGLYCLMKFNIEHSARCMRALLRQQYALHASAPREMFTFRFIAFLKLVSTLYPMRDAFHPVVSPTLAFACRLISAARMCAIKDITRMLLMVRMLSSFVEESKRYLPEVIAFLHGIFLMAVESRDDERCPMATFPISLPHRRMLFVTDDCSTIEIPSQLDVTQVFADDIDSFEESNKNRLCVLNIAFTVLCRFSFIYSNIISFSIIFRPLLGLLSRLPRNLFPAQLLTELSALESFITAQSSRNLLKQLQRPMKQKKMLNLLEPRFDENRDIKKAQCEKKIAKKSEKVEIKQLTKKYKKELRGTVRELRRDNQFLNREKRREMLENDKVRKEKTKWLISTLQGQESEYKKNAHMKHKL
uniref:Nucleolar protein 14 n=1 Tax=Loa loa TaxID=7209 RepID=A0A1I7VGJ0_LOALO